MAVDAAVTSYVAPTGTILETEKESADVELFDIPFIFAPLTCRFSPPNPELPANPSTITVTNIAFPVVFVYVVPIALLAVTLLTVALMNDWLKATALLDEVALPTTNGEVEPAVFHKVCQAVLPSLLTAQY